MPVDASLLFLCAYPSPSYTSHRVPVCLLAFFAHPHCIKIYIIHENSHRLKTVFGTFFALFRLWPSLPKWLRSPWCYCALGKPPRQCPFAKAVDLRAKPKEGKPRLRRVAMAVGKCDRTQSDDYVYHLFSKLQRCSAIAPLTHHLVCALPSVRTLS